eukprot:TRINITY_DN20893_c0_g1_i1.p1 TRINITY_DN20893_c0_g1~~TRINITY_DN20893_c0_g1_i1.p1  ORF type:complete len:443 (+),score=105.34 TRINITY_DN20893_c0_g1_i1:34-1362(+)
MPPKVPTREGYSGRFRGPKNCDEDMPPPRWVAHKPLEQIEAIPERLRKLRACWVEVVQKVCKGTGLKKERYLIVMEYFLAFAHMDGTISKVTCLADVFRIYYTEKGRFFIELRSCANGMHYIHYPNHRFNRARTGAAYPSIPLEEEQWLIPSYINNARGAFTRAPLRLVQTPDIHQSIRSRCIPITPPVLVPGMDFAMVHLKKEPHDMLGLGFYEDTLMTVVEGGPGDRAGCSEHIGKRLIVLNGVAMETQDAGTEVASKCEGLQWVSLVFDTTRVASVFKAIALPADVEVARESVSETFGLRFNDSLVLVDVPKRPATRHLRPYRGLCLTHMNDEPVVSLSSLLASLEASLAATLTFDSNNEVFVHLPDGQEFRNSGLVLSPSLHLLGVKKGTPAYRSCAQFEKRYKILKANGQIVTNMAELREVIDGYLTFRLFFQAIRS